MNEQDKKETTAETVISKECVNHSNFIPEEGDNFCGHCGKKLTTSG